MKRSRVRVKQYGLDHIVYVLIAVANFSTS
jgi:hypothetical protein